MPVFQGQTNTSATSYNIPCKIISWYFGGSGGFNSTVEMSVYNVATSENIIIFRKMINEDTYESSAVPFLLLPGYELKIYSNPGAINFYISIE